MSMTTEGTTGLLKRASALRSSQAGEDSAELDRRSGITPEDRKEIQARIEELTKGARLTAEPGLFKVKAKSSGLLFPVLVNLAAALLVAGGLFGLSYLFREREAAVAQSDVAVSSAEGKLIRELQRESASKLDEKDKEIADIQLRLASLDKERGALAATIEERVRARELELRAALDAELRRERERLLAEGLSEAVIQERLKKFEAEKTAAFRRELAEFQAKAEAERQAAEANYQKLRDEYQKSIAGLAEERKRIQDESRRREEELRASLEASMAARTQSLQAKSAEAEAGLAAAKAELARVQDEKAKATAAEDRVVGLYGSVRQALRDRRFDEAALQAAALRSYLDDPGVANLPGLQARRSADIFAAETLAAYAKSELDRAGSDAARLLRQAELLQAALDSAAAGERALKDGDGALAERKYREALEKSPEILKAHEYFLARSGAAVAEERARLDTRLLQAEEAYKAGDYPAAAARYQEALAYLPIEESARLKIVSRLAEGGAFEADKARRAADTKAAREPLAQARRDLAASRFGPALAGYVGLLASFPAADQAPEARRGAETARLGLAKAAEDAAKAAEGDSAALRAEAERLARELESETRRLSEETRLARAEGASALESLAAAKDARISELERLLETARAETAAARAAAPGAAAPGATGGQAPKGQAAPAPGSEAALAGLQRDIDALKAENERLAAASARYDAVLASYKDYLGAEDAVLASGGANALVEGRAKLDAFLSGPAASAALPGLRERIARYERAFQEAGQREVLFNAMDIVENALRQRDEASRDRYFKDLEGRYANDATMLEFIKGLRKSVK